MTEQDSDRDLRDRFAALRNEDERLAPDFRRPVAPARAYATSSLRRREPPGRARYRAWRVSGLITLLTLAFFFGQYVGNRSPDDGPVVQPSIGEWRSPTDFLLDTPGRGLLQTLPAVGGWPPDLWQPPSRPAGARPL